jgi:hypothetical protein
MVNVNDKLLVNVGNLVKQTASKIKDSISVELQAKYQRSGLTHVSNNTNVVPRNENGNISAEHGSNPLLIIEPAVNQITTKSVLRVIDTQFNYFKFPARTSIIEEESVDLDLDLDLQLDLQDPIFARYRPSEDRKIVAASIYSGILMDDVQDGNPQQYENVYTISKEIKNSGVDLRFRIKLQHRYDAPGGFGTAFFSIIKVSEQGLDREYRTFENTSQFVPNTPGSINQYEVQDLEIDIVIPNSEFEIGDRFGIGAKAGQNNDTQFHTINALQSYWVITDASKNVDLWNQEIDA